MSYVVIRSELIETLEEARAYYAERLVGDHSVVVGDRTLVLRFNQEEIHLFTEEVIAGRTPPPEKLVRRPGVSGETRVFSKQRARLMDQVLPTVRAPVRVLRAKIASGALLVGPPTLDSGARLAVVVAPGREADLFFVRTCYPMSVADFARALAGKPKASPWPPE
ncbi:MAG: hypothetical protein HS104_14335 [Polyangiaceae bacterium]|nr:hypothetical protein [Polyangiaceae bacterium]MCL4748911.1 hypothetical protein [Myxococcales bacterium]